MVWYAVIISYYALLTLLIVSKYRGRSTAILVTKTLTSLGFVAVALIALQENPGAAGYGEWILVGLTLGVGGDVFLVYGENVKLFVAGLFCFLLGHIAYGTVFSLLSGFSIWSAVFLILFVGAGVFVRRRWKINTDKVTVPAGVYLVVISGMTAQALSLCVTMGPSVMAVMAGVGALLFFASDAILAWDRFKKPFMAAKAVNLATYYTGQLLLAASVLYYAA